MKYISYLVRFWQKDSQTVPEPWQVEIESIQTGERWLFNDPAQALKFLKQQHASSKPPTSKKGDNDQA